MLCAYTRPRYQVSFYRTIGPLVFRVCEVENQRTSGPINAHLTIGQV